MKKLILLLPMLVLAACGQEPAPEPVPTQTAAVVPAKPSLPAPDAKIFAAAFAAACPEAEPVNNSVCKRAGLGSTDAVCEYGLGKDEYLRHKATITPVDGAWTIANPETTCAEHGAD